MSYNPNITNRITYSSKLSNDNESNTNNTKLATISPLHLKVKSEHNQSSLIDNNHNIMTASSYIEPRIDYHRKQLPMKESPIKIINKSLNFGEDKRNSVGPEIDLLKQQNMIELIPSPIKTNTPILMNRKYIREKSVNIENSSSSPSPKAKNNRDIQGISADSKTKFIVRHIFYPIKPLGIADNYPSFNEFVSRLGRVEDQPKRYKCYIADGNNSDLIRRIIRKRYWFREIKESSSSIQFIWQPTSRGIVFDRLTTKSQKQMVNHFEFHREITTKIGLIRNLQLYCEFNQIELFDLTPITFIIDLEDKNADYDVQEFIKFFQQYESNNSKTSINHLNGYTMTENSHHQLPLYSYTSYNKPMLSNNNNTKPSFINLSYRPYYAYSKPKMYETFYKGSNLWLMKPTDNNRGRGINIFNSLKKFKQYLTNNNLQEQTSQEIKPIKRPDTTSWAINNGRSILPSPIVNNTTTSNITTLANSINQSQSPAASANHNLNYNGGFHQHQYKPFKGQKYVLQKYIESPMLINKRKFDIRVWVLLDQDMNLYFFKEGYLRMSSELFSIDQSTIENKFVHLTNNAVQKYSTSYGRFENGNQLSFANFEKYLADHYPQANFKGKILPRMKELVIYSMCSVRLKINQNFRRYCFEIFGYDFIIDSDGKIWLIEVNTNPCIEESSNLLRIILPRMIDDAFKLTVDKIFTPILKKPDEINQLKNNMSSSGIYGNYINEEYHVDGYKDDENMWELLLENITNSKLKNNHKFRPKKINLIT